MKKIRKETVINEIMKLDEEQAEVLLNLLVEQVFNKRNNKEYSKKYVVNKR